MTCAALALVCWLALASPASALEQQIQGDGTDSLGGAVAPDGDTLVAGASAHRVGASSGQGAVYTFARTGAADRTETAELTARSLQVQAHAGANRVHFKGSRLSAGLYRITATPTGGAAHAVMFRVGRRSTR